MNFHKAACACLETVSSNRATIKHNKDNIKTPFFILFSLIFWSSKSQTTKSIFYGLPIDRPFSEVIKSIKGQPDLFKIDTSITCTSCDHIKIEAHSEKPPTFLPKTRNHTAEIAIHETNTQPDSVKLYKYSLFTVFVYSSPFNSYKKAKKAFTVVNDIILKEYKNYTDTPLGAVYKKNPLGQLRRYYKNNSSDSDLSVELHSFMGKNIWTIIVRQGLKE